MVSQVVFRRLRKWYAIEPMKPMGRGAWGVLVMWVVVLYCEMLRVKNRVNSSVISDWISGMVMWSERKGQNEAR